MFAIRSSTGCTDFLFCYSDDLEICHLIDILDYSFILRTLIASVPASSKTLAAVRVLGEVGFRPLNLVRKFEPLVRVVIADKNCFG